MSDCAINQEEVMETMEVTVDWRIPSDLAYSKFVWDTLSKLDVQDHVEMLPATKKRPAIGYVAWHRAWALLKRNFPASTYEHKDLIIHNGGTCEVEVYVYIRDTFNREPQFTSARLPVMDHYFNPILDPNSGEINKARQRCLVKALAFAGLGLNLWSESPLPIGKLDDPISAKQLKTLEDLIVKTKTEREFFIEWCECELDELPKERYASAFGLLSAKLKGVKK